MKKILLALIIAIMLVVNASAATYQGVDIAHYAYSVNFPQLKASGHGDFVYIKVLEGSGWVDPKWAEFTAGARSAGVPFGFYQYFHSGSAAYAVSQADSFYRLIKDTGYSIIPAVDVEETDGNDAPVIQASLRVFITEFNRLSGTKPVIYSYTSFINEFIGSRFTDCKLWQADYRGSAPAVTGWGNKHTIWQYSGDKVHIKGIDNPADLDLAADSSMFLSSTAAKAASTTPAASPWTKDVYKVGTLPCVINSRAAANFDVRDADGTVVSGHEVSSGDGMIVLGVNYERQLAEVLYPSYSIGSWIHGWISNLPAMMHNTGHNQWLNGSTAETVFNTGGQRIGTIFPHERATTLYTLGGRTAILYTTSKGSETKSGFVKYAGK